MARWTIHQKDKNEKEIVTTLRGVGATVGYWGDDNAPDLVVGYRGINYLMEIKMPGKKLRDGQKKWHDAWRGVVYVVDNANHALWIVGAIEELI